jgi:O-antigen ligase
VITSTPVRVSSLPVSLAGQDRDLHRDRVAAGALAVPIALMPVLRPAFIATVTPVDLTIVLGVGIAAIWLGSSGLVVRLPFALSMGLMIAAGVFAAMLGAHAILGMQAILQDLLMLAWCLAIANVCRTPESLGIVVGAWVWSAIAWAGLLVASASFGIGGISGQDVAAGRASLTFPNPNQAGSYFAVSLMVLLAAGVPRRRAARRAAVILVAIAIIFTSSNAALGGTFVGLLLAGVLIVRRRKGTVPAIAVGVLATLALVAVAVVLVGTGILTSAQESDIRIVRNTLGRSEQSADDRLLRFDELRDLYLSGGVIGYGPAASKQTQMDLGVSIPKSAHNDLFATLVERGVIGVVGLALLIGSLARKAASLASGRLLPAFTGAILATPYLVGGVVIVAIASISHEVLHFRHVWALFGVMAAVDLWAVDRSSGVPGREGDRRWTTT